MTKIYLCAKLAAVCAAIIMCCQCFTKEETFEFDYCNHTYRACRNKPHILCLNHDFDVSITCTQGYFLEVYENKFLTPDDQVKIVRLHNSLRALVTKGMVPNQPPALNMKIMIWDAELAMMAKLTLVKCNEVNLYYQCLTTRHNDTVAKHMLKTGQYAVGFIANFYEMIIETWFEQYREVPPGIVYNFSAIPAEVTAEITYLAYTQIAWANTFKVGCERLVVRAHLDPNIFNETMVRRYKNYTSETLFCLYAPAGNIYGEPMYEAGPELEWVVDTEEDDVPASARDIVPGPLFLQVVAISLLRLISA